MERWKDSAIESLEFTIVFGMSMSIVQIMARTVKTFPNLKQLNLIVAVQAHEFVAYSYVDGKGDLFEIVRKGYYTPRYHRWRMETYKEYLEILQALKNDKDWKVSIRFVLQDEIHDIMSRQSIIIALDPGLSASDEKNGRQDIQEMLNVVEKDTPFLYCDSSMAAFSLSMMTGMRKCSFQ